MEHPRLPYRQFSEEERRKIIFKDLTTGQEAHTTFLDPAGVADYRSVIGYFAQTIIREMRLVSGYDVLFGKIKAFVQTEMFDRAVELEEPNTLRNMSEITATKRLIETFKKAINDLTVQNVNGAEIRDTIKLSDTRPFVAKDRAHLRPKKAFSTGSLETIRLNWNLLNPWRNGKTLRPILRIILPFVSSWIT